MLLVTVIHIGDLYILLAWISQSDLLNKLLTWANGGGYHHREVPLIGSDPPILKQPKRTQHNESSDTNMGYILERNN